MSHLPSVVALSGCGFEVSRKPEGLLLQDGLKDTCVLDRCLGDCGGINPYTLTARLGPEGLAHYETSSRLDPTAWSFA